MYNTDLPNRAELPSTAKLLRSTAAAALIAAFLLITTVLPAEYGIDPTGIGTVLGLTPMGEIKVSLAAEANGEGISTAGEPSAPPLSPAPPAMIPPSETQAENALPPNRQDSLTVTLKPGQAAEIKLAMTQGAIAHYEWSTRGGPVNYDTHGDPVSAPKDFYHGYGKGRSVTSDTGQLQAAFDGTHGWFWRNRSGVEVTITLKTSGDYTEIKRVL